MEWLFSGPSEGVKWRDILISFGILAGTLFLAKPLSRALFYLVERRFHPEESHIDWSKSFRKPVQFIFLLTGTYIAAYYLMHGHPALMYWINRSFRSLGIIAAGWGLYRVSASSSVLLEGMSRKIGLDESSMLIPFLSKVVRFVVILLIIIAVGTEWGFNINGLAAGLGLGSLAVALAAKETLGNILGGIVIIVEKPFSRGDWIMTPTVEGIVEDITFRSSRIRTFADSLVTVPNATLADQPITNWSRMGKRRVTFTLNAALESDRTGLENAVKRLEDMLRSDPDIDPQMIMVRFTEFRESSLGIFFYYFTRSTVWAEHLAVRQRINLAILRILEEEGVRLAYPTQRIFTAEEEKQAVFSYGES